MPARRQFILLGTLRRARAITHVARMTLLPRNLVHDQSIFERSVDVMLDFNERISVKFVTASRPRTRLKMVGHWAMFHPISLLVCVTHTMAAAIDWVAVITGSFSVIKVCYPCPLWIARTRSLVSTHHCKHYAESKKAKNFPTESGR
jgi:hypothetical protein